MTLKRLATLLSLLVLGLIGWSYWTAVSDPVVRIADVNLDGWPPGEPGLSAVLISDLHVAGPDMPPARLRRIVRQVNALEPDLVLIAGDLISDRRIASRHYSLTEAIRPLAELRALRGAIAVLGNHDHWRDAAEARRALKGAGIKVLDNQAIRIGPIAVGGLDDAFTHHDDLGATVGALRGLGGASILLSHSPDPFPEVPADVQLMLAGHTHCGQIRLPLIGAISTMSDYGERYACGRIDEHGKTLIVSAGLGTSIMPLRLGAAPDVWLVRMAGEPQGAAPPAGR